MFSIINLCFHPIVFYTLQFQTHSSPFLYFSSLPSFYRLNPLLSRLQVTPKAPAKSPVSSPSLLLHFHFHFPFPSTVTQKKRPKKMIKTQTMAWGLRIWTEVG
ncbi:hypothetical protein CFOL_v3_22900 [Cephalotus follicularis]|uniref:Uncharacterized protein n=1 Tax=Cephalotus follicularis TaxID=3775 RepID=A0A1Q3CGT6_CEPFO|nr:hypothetical protein CFOL_v3_22900 [Cephalotus follicularis]